MSQGIEAIVKTGEEQNNEASTVITGETRFLVVKGESHHVWIDSTHYVTVGEVDTVSDGDMFLQLQPEYVIYEVLDSDVSDSEQSINEEVLVDDASVVEVKTWMVEPNEECIEQAQSNSFTGVENPAMGYTGPPLKLEEVSD